VQDNKTIVALDKINIADLKKFLNQVIQNLTSLSALSDKDRLFIDETYREIENILAEYRDDVYLSATTEIEPSVIVQEPSAIVQKPSATFFDDQYQELQVQYRIQSLKKLCQNYKDAEDHLLLNKWLLAMTHWRIRQYV